MKEPKHDAKGLASKAARKTVAPKWQTVVVPKIVRCEGRDFLTKGQYLHVADFVRQLVGFGSKLYDPTLDVRQIGDYWELREKWGVLGRINVRIYFAYLQDVNEIAVLHAYKKEDDGATPAYVLLRVQNRLRMYRRGELADDATRIEASSDDQG